MNYDPLAEITMPDLSGALAKPEEAEPEAAPIDPEEIEEEGAELDVESISDKTVGTVSSLRCSRTWRSRVTEAKPAGKTEQELLAEDMYMKRPSF